MLPGKHPGRPIRMSLASFLLLPFYLNPHHSRNAPPCFSIADAVALSVLRCWASPPLALDLTGLAQTFHCRPQLAVLCLTMSHAMGSDTTGSEEVRPDARGLCTPHLLAQGFAAKSHWRQAVAHNPTQDHYLRPFLGVRPFVGGCGNTGEGKVKALAHSDYIG